VKKEDKMSFYVALPSHANRHEFPNNQANAFKIRLPQPLWQVGLSASSLPDTHVNLYDLVQKDGYVMWTSWDQTYPKPGGKDGETATRVGTAETLINDMNNGRIVTYERQKLGLSAYYDKRWVLEEGIHTEPIECHV